MADILPKGCLGYVLEKEHNSLQFVYPEHLHPCIMINLINTY